MTTEIHVPDAVRWAVATWDNQRTRATAIKADMDRLSARIDETARMLQDLRETLAERGREYTSASENAALLRRMAELLCVEIGIAVPDPPATIPLLGTGEIPPEVIQQAADPLAAPADLVTDSRAEIARATGGHPIVSADPLGQGVAGHTTTETRPDPGGDAADEAGFQGGRDA